jgi:hypothetical protein
MTEKAKKILQKMKRRRALLRSTNEYTASPFGSVGPFGDDQEMKVLSEMNSFAYDHDSGCTPFREKLRDKYTHRKRFSIFESHRIYTMMSVG